MFICAGHISYYIFRRKATAALESVAETMLTWTRVMYIIYLPQASCHARPLLENFECFSNEDYEYLWRKISAAGRNHCAFYNCALPAHLIAHCALAAHLLLVFCSHIVHIYIVCVLCVYIFVCILDTIIALYTCAACIFISVCAVCIYIYIIYIVRARCA